MPHSKEKREPKEVKCRYCSTTFYTASLNFHLWVCGQCKIKNQHSGNKIACAKYQRSHRNEIDIKRLPKRNPYYEQNKEKIKANVLKYYYQNKQKCLDRIYKYEAMKLKTNPTFKMQKTFRHRLGDALNRIKANKTTRSAALVGCDWKTLKNHIESKFQQGMNWDNHGIAGWHVDHILPCSSFDLSKIEEQKKCFHYSNLQPLWAEENHAKGDKLDWFPNT